MTLMVVPYHQLEKKKKKEEVKTSSYLSWLEWNAERSYFISTETLSSVFFP